MIYVIQSIDNEFKFVIVTKICGLDKHFKNVNKRRMMDIFQCTTL